MRNKESGGEMSRREEKFGEMGRVEDKQVDERRGEMK